MAVRREVIGRGRKKELLNNHLTEVCKEDDMIGVEELREAMESRNEQLKREMRHNRRVIAGASKWKDAVDAHVEAARKAFEVIGDPKAEIEWDPETGKPYVCVTVDVTCREREQIKAYHRYSRQVSDVQYMHLIVLDVNPVEG